MAHFRGTVQGSRGEASRCGTKASGLCVTANGWNIGTRIELFHDSKTGKDTLRICITKGSNNNETVHIIEKTEEQL